eukprot:6394092-Pyramimonas_sp.AAC.1
MSAGPRSSSVPRRTFDLNASAPEDPSVTERVVSLSARCKDLSHQLNERDEEVKLLKTKNAKLAREKSALTTQLSSNPVGRPTNLWGSVSTGTLTARTTHILAHMFWEKLCLVRTEGLPGDGGGCLQDPHQQMPSGKNVKVDAVKLHAMSKTLKATEGELDEAQCLVAKLREDMHALQLTLINK